MERYLISNTTRGEREKIVQDALAISQIDAGPPDETTMNLFQEYINGTIEITEVQKRVIENAKNWG